MIDRCIRCDYSLEGLPTVHPCPECGRENDRESTVVREPRFWTQASIVFGGVAMYSVYMPLLKSASSWRIMIVLAVLMLAWIWIQASRRARMVVVSRRFLELINEGSKTELYSMEDVGDARCSFVTGRTKIADRQGRVIVTIPNKFLNSLRANRKVVLAIKAQVARRDAAAPAEDVAPAV